MCVRVSMWFVNMYIYMYVYSILDEVYVFDIRLGIYIRNSIQSTEADRG